jgi:hypothetical protein
VLDEQDTRFSQAIHQTEVVMESRMATLFPAVASLCVALSASPLGAQSNVPKVANPACALLSVAEIRKITGRQEYDHPWAAADPGEGVGGGSACVYEYPVTALDGPPPIGFTLISGKDWTQSRRGVRLLDGCTRDPVKGVGDDAYFESCPSKTAKKRTDPLYVKVGPNDLIVQMDVKAPATEASSRPTVIALARALAAKLR